jgi:hypothetical protein
MSDHEPESVEKSRRLREKLRKERGLSNEPVSENKNKEGLPSRQKIQEEKDLKEKYKPVKDSNYTSHQRGLYDMMSSHPVLDKIARYWGFHLTQGLGLHIVISILLFIGISSLISYFIVSPLFSGFFFGLVGLFLVTLPLTTRAMFYGVGYYRKFTGGF